MSRLGLLMHMHGVARGGEISSGATLDVRARYFFAMDPADPWVMRLFAKSVVVRIYYGVGRKIYALILIFVCRIGDPRGMDCALHRRSLFSTHSRVYS